jgi:hypothetical protein
MESIVAEIMKIMKGANDSISCEEQLKTCWSVMFCEAVMLALDRIDDELAEQWKADGWYVERRDERTVVSSFGAVRFKRRRMERDGESGKYPLDEMLGLRKYKHYTPYFEAKIAQIAASATYRVTAEAVSSLTPADISHQKVANIVRSVGERYEQWEDCEKEAETADETEPLRQPEVLLIEGDGLTLREQKGGKKMELHRFQIAEGVRCNGKRRELVNAHYVAEFSHKAAKERIEAYIAEHYDLRHTLVLSNSDGGSGYGKEVFEEIVGRGLRHEHFRDRYHINRKIKDRVAWAGGGLSKRLHEALRERDIERVGTVLDTMESKAADSAQAENVDKLRAYLQRNWEYMASLRDRGLGAYARSLGTCESNHRLYSYRMKKQGRCWSKRGGQAMVHILTGLKNGDLYKAMTATVDNFKHATLPELRHAVRDALRHGKWQEHEGIQHGSVALDAPVSSAMGNLWKMTQARAVI